MRLGTIVHDGRRTVLLETEGQWLDLTRAHQAFQLIASGKAEPAVDDLRVFLERGWAAPSYLADVTGFLQRHDLIAPFRVSRPASFALPYRPGKIVALGRNYAAHARETGFDAPEEPILFAKATSACIGDGEAIVIRESYGRVDHEGELAVVIGRRARYVPDDEAADYIAGYTLLNDITARGVQKADIAQGLPWFRSKSMDTFCPLGPVVALPDEMPWPPHVDLELAVNGDVRQRCNTDQWLFEIGRVIAFVTRFVTLDPGDIIATGTPEGIGTLKPGDTVTVSVAEIGTLTNPVTLGA